MREIASVSNSRGNDGPSACGTAASAPKPRKHVAYIEYFRAVAILMIICGHTYALSWTHFADEDPQNRVTWLNIVPALVTGGTAYFVFISGFLYRQVFYMRTTYSDFMRKKALYVGLPYLVLATPMAFAEIWLAPFSVVATKAGEAYPHSYFVDFIVLFSTGRMVTAYWYIPFIFLVFLASPLFDRFLGLSPGKRFSTLAASILVALWIVRPAENLNPVQCFFYFANVYMFGILFCEYQKPIMEFIRRPMVVAGLGILLIGIASFQAMWMHFTDNLERMPGDGWGFVGFDAMLVQKYAGIFFFCGLLALVSGWLERPLSFVAEHSFGLFFIHGIVIAGLMRLPQSFSPHSGEPILDLALYSVVVMLISLAVVVAVKHRTGRYSRYIVGS